jgi:hypothetical protein
MLESLPSVFRAGYPRTTFGVLLALQVLHVGMMFGLCKSDKLIIQNTVPTLALNGILLVLGVLALFGSRRPFAVWLAVAITILLLVGTVVSMPLMYAGAADWRWLLAGIFETLYFLWAILTLAVLFIRQKCFGGGA